jgi:uncharacterized repeat protein (TIGR03803 family)
MRTNFFLIAISILFLLSTAFAQDSVEGFHFIANTKGYIDGGTLVADAQGNLYGAVNLGFIGAGGVYELTPEADEKWNLIILDDDNLDFPNEGLAIDAQGNLYGSDTLGGSFGEGCVFELSPNGDGTFTRSTIYSFHGIEQPGGPNGDLLLDSEGNIYGTTGGNGNELGPDVAFELQRMSNGYRYVLLHSFCSSSNCSDGQYPKDGLTMDANGNLYGTTAGGGEYQYGTVYELTNTNGKWSETVLHSFDAIDGIPPSPSLEITIDAKGNRYGTTQSGGSANNGTVFEIDAAGKFSTLYSFTGQPDGANPYSDLSITSDGSLLGTTLIGGDKNNGTVFILSRNSSGEWIETDRYSIQQDLSTDGPVGGLYNNKAQGTWFGLTSSGEVFEFKLAQ